MADESSRVGMGGGCHWCTEAVFQALRGVVRVEQGHLRAQAPHGRWSEGVIVHFDPRRISLETLIEVHLATHSATSAHGLRHRYRSAVYVLDDDQARRARAALQGLAAGLAEPLQTLVLPLVDFRPSPERYRDYYRKGRERPFSRRYIQPKLEALQAAFGPWLKGP